MTAALDIRPAETSAAFKQFVELPYRLYAQDPLWVPPLRSAQKKLFTRQTAFFEHGEMELLLACRDGRPVGRIAAIQNHAHNLHHKDRVGFFGFFECLIDDAEAAVGLVRSAERWLAGRGLTSLRGPVNPSMNAECGLLIEGFDHPPAALMPYNPAAYAGLLESAGLAKCKDLLAYQVIAEKVQGGAGARERLDRMVAIARRRHPEVSVRTINMRDFAAEIPRFMAIFEQARRNNWGYVPISEAELMETARDLKQVIDPDLVLMAVADGEPAGASLAIPNINHGLAAARGSLFPLGFLRFLRAMKKVHDIRVLGIAALPRYRHLGIAGLLMLETITRGLPKGYDIAEASWVLEDNVMSNRTIQSALDPRHYKTYRIYEKAIAGIVNSG